MNSIIKFLLYSCLLTGCGDSSDDATEQNPITAKLVLRDTFNQESDIFVQGENIRFVLSLTNHSEEAVTLNFSSSQQHDLYIISTSGNEVWRWSDDKAFLTLLTDLVIQAGDSFEINEIWDQKLADGGNISIGNYIALGSFMQQSPEVEFSFIIQ